MNTTSLELSKELYLLSGWEYATHQWLSPYEDSHPVYDLGYLLRKLPARVRVLKEYEASPDHPEETPAYYYALYDTIDSRHFWLGATTPEDALALVAIDLFKQGVIIRE